MRNPNAVILFLKAPIPGMVKTRLQAHFGEAQALALYQAMVGDLLKNLGTNNSFDLHLFYWPAEGAGRIQDWLGAAYPVHLQEGENLGAKMHRAFQKMFRQNYRQAVLIGSDLPILNSRFLDHTFRRFENAEVVLGPSEDGGYYLIGLNREHPELFANVEWSSATVLEQTLSNARLAGLTVSLTKKLRDVDTYEDVYYYCERFRRAEKSRRKVAAPETYRILKEIIQTANHAYNGNALQDQILSDEKKEN